MAVASFKLCQKASPVWMEACLEGTFRLTCLTLLQCAVRGNARAACGMPPATSRLSHTVQQPLATRHTPMTSSQCPASSSNSYPIPPPEQRSPVPRRPSRLRNVIQWRHPPHKAPRAALATGQTGQAEQQCWDDHRKPTEGRPRLWNQQLSVNLRSTACEMPVMVIIWRV